MLALFFFSFFVTFFVFLQLSIIEGHHTHTRTEPSMIMKTKHTNERTKNGLDTE